MSAFYDSSRAIWLTIKAARLSGLLTTIAEPSLGCDPPDPLLTTRPPKLVVLDMVPRPPSG